MTAEAATAAGNATAGKKGRDFLSFWDVPDGGIEALIRRAEELRAVRDAGTPHPTRPGRVVGLVYEKA